MNAAWHMKTVMWVDSYNKLTGCYMIPFEMILDYIYKLNLFIFLQKKKEKAQMG